MTAFSEVISRRLRGAPVPDAPQVEPPRVEPRQAEVQDRLAGWLREHYPSAVQTFVVEDRAAQMREAALAELSGATVDTGEGSITAGIQSKTTHMFGYRRFARQFRDTGFETELVEAHVTQKAGVDMRTEQLQATIAAADAMTAVVGQVRDAASRRMYRGPGRPLGKAMH